MLDLGRMHQALETLGDALLDRGLEYRLVVVGGAALLLPHQGRRPTQDVDVLTLASAESALRVHFELPEPLAETARDVAASLDLAEDWLNCGAAGVLADRLPAGYESRLETRTFGGLRVCLPDRIDLLRLKLFAASDEGPWSRHVTDLQRMAPAPAELDVAAGWVNNHYPGGRCPGLDEILSQIR
jgi:hypothetical protein